MIAYRMNCLVSAALVASLLLFATSCSSSRAQPHGSAARHESVGTVAWSPDGKQIAWQSSEVVPGVPPAYKSTLWVANADGSHAYVRNTTKWGGIDLAWLPGDHFIWISDGGITTLARGETNVRLLGGSIFDYSTDRRANLVAWGAPPCPNCDGPVVVQSLTDGSKRSWGGKHTQDETPTLSPDGRRLIFARSKCPPNYDCSFPDGLWLASTTGHSVSRIARDGNCPLWSPDGKSILFMTRNGALALMNPDGTHRRTLVAVSCNVGPNNRAWAPNSKSIAYWGPSALDGLHLIEIATKRIRKLTDSRLAHVYGFAWSPDSTKLLVAAAPDFKSCASLWLVRADGSGDSLLRRC